MHRCNARLSCGSLCSLTVKWGLEWSVAQYVHPSRPLIGPRLGDDDDDDDDACGD